MVWMQRRKGAERCMSKRLEKCSKGEESSTWSREPESAARERGSRKKVRRIFKMLKEV